MKSKLSPVLRVSAICLTAAIALVTTFLVVTSFANAHGRVEQSLVPEAGDTWYPVSGTVRSLLARFGPTQQLTATVLSTFPTTIFTSTNAWYRIYNPDIPLVDVTVPLTSPNSMRMVNNGAFITVTTQLLYGTGQRILIHVPYSDGSGYAESIYLVQITYNGYLSLINVPDLSDLYQEPNDNPCQARAAVPGMIYNGIPNDAYDFYSLTLPTTATVYITVSNYIVPGQLQFRAGPISACSATTGTIFLTSTVISPGPVTTAIVSTNVAPGNYFARVSPAGDFSTTPYTFTWNYVAPAQPGNDYGEPNDNPCQARLAVPLVRYLGIPSDSYDFFQLNIPTTSTVLMTVTNYTVVGQLQLRSPLQDFNCSPTSSTTILNYTTMPPTSQNLVSYNIPPGIYFARLSTAGDTNSIPYTFTWNYLPTASGAINPCLALPASPNLPYNGGVPTNRYDFYKINVPITSSVLLTMYNYLGTGQMQLRSDLLDTNCSPTSTTSIINYTAMPPANQSLVTYNITPGNYYVRISNDTTLTTSYTFMWGYVAGGGLLEPNENSCQAVPMVLGTKYQKYPQDSEDWFSFDLSAQTSIVISLTNYTGTGGQVQLYRQGLSCSDIGSIISYAAITGSPGKLTLSVANQPSGHYFIRVYTGGGYNTTTLYTLAVYPQSSYWSPLLGTCPTFTNCSDHAVNLGGGNFAVTIYWAQVPGVTQVTVQFAGAVLSPCPAGPTFTDTITDQGTLLSGNKQYQNLVTGYTAITISVFRSSDGASGSRSVPMKVNCDPPGFNLFPLLPTLTAPSSTETQGPVETPVPPPVIVPDVRPTPMP